MIDNNINNIIIPSFLSFRARLPGCVYPITTRLLFTGQLLAPLDFRQKCIFVAILAPGGGPGGKGSAATAVRLLNKRNSGNNQKSRTVKTASNLFTGLFDTSGYSGKASGRVFGPF